MWGNFRLELRRAYLDCLVPSTRLPLMYQVKLTGLSPVAPHSKMASPFLMIVRFPGSVNILAGSRKLIVEREFEKVQPGDH